MTWTDQDHLREIYNINVCDSETADGENKRVLVSKKRILQWF